MESGKPYFEDVAAKVMYWEPWWKLCLTEPPPPRRDCRQAFENIALTPERPPTASVPTESPRVVAASGGAKQNTQKTKIEQTSHKQKDTKKQHGH